MNDRSTPLDAASTSRRALLLGSFGALGALGLAGCGSSNSSSTSATSSAASPATAAASAAGGSGKTLNISAIPDQDPELLNRLYPTLATYLSQATGLKIEYKPLTDYTAVVRAFEVGDIQFSWMGGLTSVQARARVEGAQSVAQRDIDANFHSVFLANKSANIAPFTDVKGLTALKGHTFTFGSETSTSGRLMPQYFMNEAGLQQSDLKGKPGFSGSHDATIEAVANGSFETGAANEQVWKKSLTAGKVDVSKVVPIFTTPAYYDYNWLARPDLDATYGAGSTQKLVDALLALTVDKAEDKQILDLFGATKFITTMNSNYDKIQQVAKQEGLLS